MRVYQKRIGTSKRWWTIIPTIEVEVGDGMIHPKAIVIQIHVLCVHIRIAMEKKNG